ncbi:MULTISPECIES: MFS transporter [Roseateles]|uniref:Na+/melibiose symporter-like transporter n=1 Tax=Pelomonas aquatica TaxID=431058 RepID=A0ABU1Z934_9BURK|nr:MULTISPECIES: MFS transporter [Roseateles]KQY90466.1 MFS transporter [Pelomonas sp. Root1444]MDR7297103.1 Na+/melibiose symporter-like transporter [Pelomonas aquatica]
MAAEFAPAQGLRYGALGFALAFVALPLYVHLPAHYATHFGLPLATLGALLLAARALDAVVDPWIGRLCDRALGRAALAWQLPLAGLLLAAGFAGLFFPLVREPRALLAWAGAGLVLTYLAYSWLAVLHQAWGARLGGSAATQSRIVAWREGLALAGVVSASLLPSLAGFGMTALVLAAALFVGLMLLAGAPRPAPAVDAPAPLALAWRVPEFRRLLAVFLLNGIAAAVPATLLLFFIDDRLRLPASQGLFLSSYFAAAVVSLPAWLRVIARVGQARAWALGMALAVAAFAWAAALGEGDRGGFLAVCVASGAALGADLAIPAALLAGVIQRAGLAGRAEGAFFGWWNAASKLNLALAAGLALPLLQALGYAPGQRDPQALQALTLAYCVLPCALKLAAAALLYRHFIAPP